ncbi:signal peptidase I [Chloroflexota bacterium]
MSDAISYSDVLTQEVLKSGFSVYLKGRGSSMYPFVRTGDLLLIEPRKPTELKIGDIIFYRRTVDLYVAHRLVRKKDSQTLVTKGDNLDYYDVPISLSQVLGIVVSIQRNGRYLKMDSIFNKFLNICWGRLSPFSKWLRIVLKPTWRLHKRIFRTTY